MLLWGGPGGLPRQEGRVPLGESDLVVPPCLPPPQELGTIRIGPLLQL